MTGQDDRPLDASGGMDETEHLLRSPRNAECLLKSIAAIAAGRVVEHDLLLDDDAVVRVTPIV